MIKIDKSLFTDDERAQYEALIAKATVDTEAGEEAMKEDKPDLRDFKERKRRVEVEYEDDDDVEMDKCRTKKAEAEKCDTKKSADPTLAAALERLETLEKSAAMKEFTDIAKKYAPLGEKEDELAQTLYDMKKSNEANYDAYIKILDKSLDMVNKSGLFTEIGKSAHGVAGDTLGRVEAIASEIMKSDTTMTREQAVAKAWIDHPELVAEYDNEYRSK